MLSYLCLTWHVFLNYSSKVAYQNYFSPPHPQSVSYSLPQYDGPPVARACPFLAPDAAAPWPRWPGRPELWFKNFPSVYQKYQKANLSCHIAWYSHMLQSIKLTRWLGTRLSWTSGYLLFRQFSSWGPLATREEYPQCELTVGYSSQKASAACRREAMAALEGLPRRFWKEFLDIVILQLVFNNNAIEVW